MEDPTFGRAPVFSAGEYRRRWETLQAAMASAGLAGGLFYQNADLLWVCGTIQAEAVLLPRSGEPVALGRSPLGRLQTDAPFMEVRLLPKLADMEGFLGSRLPDAGPLGLELDVMPWTMVEQLKGRLGRDAANASPCIRAARAVKSPEEIGVMETAAWELDTVFRAVPDIVREDVTEVELEGRLMAMARGRGHQGLIRFRGFNQEIFFGHVLSGDNGLVPGKVQSPTGGPGVDQGFSLGAGFRPIRTGDMVSVDLCGTHAGYTVDQARIFFLGEIPRPAREAYGALLEVVEDLNVEIHPGMPAGQVYDRAFELARDHGITDGFMGIEEPCPFIGHGVGLELDEWPVLARGVRTPLEEGHVYALEPRVFLPGVGVVGIEDTYHLTAEGPVRITVTERKIIEVRG